MTKTKNFTYDEFNTSIKAGNISTFYIFYGEERYLLSYSLDSLRNLICPDGINSFNYKRFDGKDIDINEFEDAINTLPAFTDKTLIEMFDFDIFTSEHKEKLCTIIADLPEYVCIVLVYGTIPYKPDGRQKIVKELLKHITVVEFGLQEQNRIIKWIEKHISSTGKSIEREDALYLAEITGCSMTILYSEIGKVTAYAKGKTVTRSDIDAVVTPVLDTVVYRLTDAIVNKKNKQAMLLLDELLQMRVVPHILLHSIHLKMRQLLAARIYFEHKKSKHDLMKLCDIRHEYPAGLLMNIARNTTIEKCQKAVQHCADTALKLNSTYEPEARIIELITLLLQ